MNPPVPLKGRWSSQDFVVGFHVGMGGSASQKLLWMDEIRFAPLGNHGQPLIVGIYRETITLGFARWCEIDFVHPQYVTVDQK